MDGFTLTAGRRSDTQGDTRPASVNDNRLRMRNGEMNFGPGYTKCLGERRLVVVQDDVCRRFSVAADCSRRRADGHRSNILLHLSAGAEPFVANFEKEGKEAADAQSDETPDTGK